MPHPISYRDLLVNHREHVLNVMRDKGETAGAKILGVSVVEHPTRPYVMIRLEKAQAFTACAGGRILDASNLDPSRPRSLVYMPYIGLTTEASPEDLEHELGHLDDLLELIEREPNYVADAARLAMADLSDPELIAESVQFEIRKIFLLEAAEFGRSYDRGTHVIEAPFFFGMVFEVPVDTKEQFVRFWMAQYIKSLESKYESRFPAHGAAIRAAFVAACEEFGAAVFGADAHARAEATLKEFTNLLLGRGRQKPS